MATMNLRNMTAVATVLLSFTTALMVVNADSPRESHIAGSDYLADLENCQPGAALATAIRRGKWRKISYETDSFSGTMLVAVEESDAPDVTYELDRTGCRRISAALWRGSASVGRA